MVVPPDDPRLSPEENALRRGAGRLNHIGMIYAGGLAELGQGRPIAMVPQGYPGLSVVRDLLQLVLFQRAEVNALMKIIRDADLVSEATINQTIADEYDWLASAKAGQFGYEVTNLGLTIDLAKARKQRDTKGDS